MPKEITSLEEAIAEKSYDRLPAHVIAEAVKDPKSGLTAEMVAEQVRGLVEQHDPELHAFVRADLGDMMDQARIIDQRVQAGDRNLGVIAGVPVSVKDTYLDQKYGAKAGTKKLYKGPDAYVVRRSKEEGAVIIGKTATPELALDTDTPGTNNPWKEGYASRGSSGGAGVATAMRMGHIHYGSDGGGSGRSPAIANGVFGIKLKRDASTETELEGHIPPLPGFMPTLDIGVPAVLARNVADLSLGLSVLKNELIAPGVHGPLKLAVMKDLGKYSPDPATARAIDHMVEAFTLAGHRVEEVPALNTLNPEDLMRLIGLAFGTKIAQCVHAGPKGVRSGGDLLKWFWRSTLAKLVIGGMVGDYNKDIEKYAHGNGGIAIEAMKEGLRKPELIEDVERQRAALKQTFDGVYRTYHGVISPLDFAGPFIQRPMLTPMNNGVPYFDATIVPASIANLTGDASIAMATELSDQGLPVGFQIMTPETEGALSIGAIVEKLMTQLAPPPKFSTIH